MKMTMTEAEALGRIKMGVNVDIKRSDGKILLIDNHLNLQKKIIKTKNVLECNQFVPTFMCLIICTHLNYPADCLKLVLHSFVG